MIQFTFRMPKFGATSVNRALIGDALEAGGQLMFRSIQKILIPHNRTGNLIGSFRGRRLSDRSFLLYSDNPVAKWIDEGTGLYGPEKKRIFISRSGNRHSAGLIDPGRQLYGPGTRDRTLRWIDADYSSSKSDFGYVFRREVNTRGMRGIRYIDQAKRETRQERGALVAAAARAEIRQQLELGTGEFIFASGRRIGQGYVRKAGRFAG